MNPVDVYSPAEMPPVEAIEAAAADYAAAADMARAADRGKRKARKLLGRLPAGLYGPWLIERVPSSRQTPDLEAIRATYTRLGLGEVPMRTCAPSLRVTAAGAGARGMTETTPDACPLWCAVDHGDLDKPVVRRAPCQGPQGRRACRDALQARLSQVLDICDREQRNAVRWENPIPVPEWVAVVRRAALGDDRGLLNG